jgi:hypothetical protein
MLCDRQCKCAVRTITTIVVVTWSVVIIWSIVRDEPLLTLEAFMQRNVWCMIFYLARPRHPTSDDTRQRLRTCSNATIERPVELQVSSDFNKVHVCCGPYVHTYAHEPRVPCENNVHFRYGSRVIHTWRWPHIYSQRRTVRTYLRTYMRTYGTH